MALTRIVLLGISLMCVLNPLNIGVNNDISYDEKLFDCSYVHSMDIQIDGEDWNSLLDTALEKEYFKCDLTIDGVVFDDVGLRTKGNTSLKKVYNSEESNRYSFKIDFDEYIDGQTCYGLDKLSLNNIFADATFMKDYIAYDLMAKVGVKAPLKSYMNITVNGEPYGLYLAVECIDDSFLKRNYGEEYDILYKPEFNDDEINNNIFNLTDTEFGGANLKYTNDDFSSYSQLFDSAKVDMTDDDKSRMINSLKLLNQKENINSVVDVENVLNFFVVDSFICNFDGYLGERIHNHYLYESEGKLSLIPWDYNYCFGNLYSNIDANIVINKEIDNPKYRFDEKEDFRPLWDNVIDGNYELYHSYYEDFLNEVIVSGYLNKEVDRVYNMIKPYVEKDVSKFCTNEEFNNAIPVLKEYIKLRSKSIENQLKQGKNFEKVDAGHIKLTDLEGYNEGKGWDGFLEKE